MKHRPLNPVMEESLRQQIDHCIEQRVVEEADSPWSFPLVPVPKKNSKEICWVVDYRRLNAVTKKDAFPLPNIEDNLSRLTGSHFGTAGLQISPEKAQLFQDHIKYLEDEVSAQGISIPSEYISVIKEWPIPNTIKTLRAFLGKCGYYRRFIADYATLSARLV